jgi:hypothetical protein
MVTVHEVDSDAMTRIGYDQPNSRLYVEFNSGKTYAYDGVAYGLYQQLMAAESRGRFFGKNIRDNYTNYESVMPVAGPMVNPAMYDWSKAGPRLVWG